MRLWAVALLFFCTVLRAGSEVTAGGYAPFIASKSADPAAPGYYYLTGRALYEPVENFILGGDLFFLHGFPEKDRTNLRETSYLIGRGRLLLQYEFPRVTIGSVSYASISDDSGSYARVIREGAATLGGYRRDDIHQELFLSSNPFAEFRFNVAAGMTTQSYEVEHELGSGIIRDSDLFAYGEMSYRIFPLLEPFAFASYCNDLNPSDAFNLFRFRGGLRGEVSTGDNAFHFLYALYYKREEASLLTEKNRFALYLKARWNIARSDTDLFAWFYHEYAFPELVSMGDGEGEGDGEEDLVLRAATPGQNTASWSGLRYVNRYVALQARQWLFDRKLALSAGSFLLIEKRAGDHWYLPVWPFFEVRTAPVTGLELYGRLQLKFDEYRTPPSTAWHYGLFQTRLEAGGGYLIGGYVQPGVLFFMDLVEAPGTPDSLGLKLLVTAFF